MKLFLFIFLFLLSPTLLADEIEDYDGQRDSWNGLSEFVKLGEAMGYEMDLTNSVDYSALSESDVLVFVYPQNEIQPNEVSRFVIDGGRVLLADDFGRSEKLLDRLEIDRVISAQQFLPHKNFHQGNTALPVFTPRGRHPLLTDVKSMIANHPSIIMNVGGPVVSFDEGAGLVYDMNLGQGKVVSVADSSMLINQMLKTMDNERFAENAIRYICENAIQNTEQCRVHILTKAFEQKGTYSPHRNQSNDLDGFVASFNAFVVEAADEINKDFLFFLSLILVIGLGVYLLSVLPLMETRNYSNYITDFTDTLPWPQSEFDWNIARFQNNENLQSDVLPMSILKESFEEIFLSELGHWPSSTQERPNIKGLTEAFLNRFLAQSTQEKRNEVQKKLLELLAVFATTPSRDRVFLENDSEIFRGDLEKYHRITIEIITIMGRLDDYEQRKWGSS